MHDVSNFNGIASFLGTFPALSLYEPIDFGVFSRSITEALSIFLRVFSHSSLFVCDQNSISSFEKLFYVLQ